MYDDSTRDQFQEEPPADRMLVGHNRSLANWMKACPSARTLEGWSQVLEAWVIIGTCCNRWSCPICGRRKVQHYARLVAESGADKLITLTVNPAKHADPRAAYDATRRQIPRLTAKLRKAYGEFEFFRILEATKRGWPHYHLIARSPYIPQAELSGLWNDLTGAPIVDVRQMNRKTNAYWYVVKYLAKQEYIPWTDRRASWTRGFFVKDDFEKGEGLDLAVPFFANTHPTDHVRWCYEGTTLERYSHNCWVIVAGRQSGENQQ